MVNACQTSGFLENRVFFPAFSIEKVPQVILEGEKEYKGAGVRGYSQPIGWLLSFFGLSSKLTFGSAEVYINNKSFSKLLLRIAQLAPQDTAGPEECARKLHALFIDYKKIGYDQRQLKEVNDNLKQTLSAVGLRKAEMAAEKLKLSMLRCVKKKRLLEGGREGLLAARNPTYAR